MLVNERIEDKTKTSITVCVVTDQCVLPSISVDIALHKLEFH